MNTQQLLEKLIRFRTITADVDENNRCTDFISAWLKKRKPGIHTRIYRIGKRKALYACTRRTKTPDLLIVCHTDVVAAETAQFTPIQKDGRMYARGASDCKVNAAIAMQLLTASGSTKSTGVLFSSDEETGGETTARIAADGVCGKITLVIDTGACSIVTKQKGILSLRLIGHGRACHSSTPWKGRNAIREVWKAFERVEKLFTLSRGFGDWKNTIAPTIISGGDVANRVPDTAELVVNIRYTERTDPEKLLARIRKKAAPVTVETEAAHPSFITPRTDPGILGFKKKLETSMGQKIPFDHLHGATDARHFSGKKAKVVISGVPGGGAHSKDEYVELSGMKKMEAALLAYLREPR